MVYNIFACRIYYKEQLRVVVMNIHICSLLFWAGKSTTLYISDGFNIETKNIP